MESTFDKEITLDCLQKIKAIPAMIPVVKKIISDLGHRSAWSFVPRAAWNQHIFHMKASGLMKSPPLRSRYNARPFPTSSQFSGHHRCTDVGILFNHSNNGIRSIWWTYRWTFIGTYRWTFSFWNVSKVDAVDSICDTLLKKNAVLSRIFHFVRFNKL